MQALLKTGGDLRLEEGHLVLTRLTAEEIPPAAKALQEEINRRLPAVDLTDILVEVDNWVGFTQQRSSPPEGTDLRALYDGKISVTPRHIDLTQAATVHDLKGRLGGAPPKL